MSRIASLLPSTTEVVCALGQGHRLVARSHECDFPAAVRALPVVTSPKLLADRSSIQIDDDIKGLLRQALAVYDVDADALDALYPDIIITQTQCEVCAVSLRDVEAAVRRMMRSKPKIVALEPTSLEDIFTDMRRVADAIGAAEAGRRLELELRHRMQTVSIREAAQRGLQPRPTVACIEWIAPLMVAGNWMPTLVQLAGGVSVLAEPGKHSPFVEMEALVEADPEVIVVMPCGFDLDKTRREMPTLDADPRWRSLRAVRGGRVYLADGNQYFNRPGPRIVESLEILVEIFHEADGQFPIDHEHTAWERWSPSAAGSDRVPRDEAITTMALEAIKVSAVIPASADAIYDAWIDGEKHSAFTGGQATVEAEIGGRHTAWDGYIEGQTLELEPGRRIVQSWRSLDFPDGAQPSLLEVLLRPVADGTEVTFNHTGIPEGQAAEYEEAWVAHYFRPMTAYFSGATTAPKQEASTKAKPALASTAPRSKKKAAPKSKKAPPKKVAKKAPPKKKKVAKKAPPKKKAAAKNAKKAPAKKKAAPKKQTTSKKKKNKSARRSR